MVENILFRKNLYKIFISSVKYIPNILALLQIASILLSYFNITSFLLTCIGGSSLIFLLLLYLISYIFRFCGLYRISLNYISLMTILTIIDFYFGIPLETIGLYKLYLFVTGIFSTIWIIYWYTHRNNPKIDHLKQLCDSICC